jgi:RNA polymerase sigma-70 factor (ECF subfamily)
MDKGQEMLAEEEAKVFEQMMTYQEDVFRICLGFSRNPSDAEDLSQDVYLKAYKGLKKIRRPYAVKEWLIRVTRNTCLDFQKKSKRARLLLQRTPRTEDGRERTTPEVSVDTHEHLSVLKNTIGRLPKKQKEIFVLREYGHLSYRDLARMLGIREGTVMSRLNRARRTVMTMMKEEVHGHRTE